MKGTEIPSVARGYGKTNFDTIYSAPDPREYFRVLVGLDYIIPDLAKGIFRSLIDRFEKPPGRFPKVVDVGCSYGINSAVIDYPVDIAGLARRYAQPEVYALSSEMLRVLDRNYFASWPRLSGARFVGVDTSLPAVSYAQAVGLLDGTVTTNLELSDPSPDEQEVLRGADLIITTGCVGYVTEQTFRRILACQDGGNPPVIASFVLRMYSYSAIEAELSRAGLVTQKLGGITFVQRRFSSTTEFESTLTRLESMGIDPTGKEADGLLHAELFVSRSIEDVRKYPLGELVSITSGENQTRGRRFRLIKDGRTEFVH
jgi:SAM-dependent methyltransferase